MQWHKVAYILKGYPRLSETFISQEIYGLEQKGIKIYLYALKHPKDRKKHHFQTWIEAPITYLVEYPLLEPFRILKAIWQYKKNTSLKSIVSVVWADMKRQKSIKPLKRLFQALVFVNECPKDVHHIHAHFIHDPTTIAYYVHLITGKSYSISAHAKDIWLTLPYDLKRKLDEAQWVTTCHGDGFKYLKEYCEAPGKIHLIYHGLDFDRFPLKKTHLTSHNGSSRQESVSLISLGRLVEKKGFDILLKALSFLPKDLHWQLYLGGGGALSRSLKNLAFGLDISEQVHFLGPLSAVEVKNLYEKGEIFILPSRITQDGDRDGIPNVLMEAMSQGVPVISTRISGIPELIHNEKNGILVAPEDPEVLKEAMQMLILNPDLRHQYAIEAQNLLKEQFDFRKGINQIEKLFRNHTLLHAA